MTRCKCACALSPESDGAYADLGNILTVQGDLEAARLSLHRAILIAPKAAHFAKLAKAGKFAPDDPLIETMRCLANDPRLSPEDRLLAEFALGKAYDDAGFLRQSFEHVTAGNAMMRARIAYDEEAALSLIASIGQVFTKDLLERRAGAGDPSPKPVFVVGMPRSGSTLIARILASHHAIASIDESNGFAAAKNDALGISDLPPFPFFAPLIDEAAFGRIARGYLARLDAAVPGALRVVNKMPGNFAYLGVIALALPGAKIIYPRRDPMDTCLSCYCELFAEGHPYAYDLRELARFWKACDGLMAHWREVLPAGMLIEIDYQALVEDPETESRRMIGHLGLPWDPSCLTFAETEGPVRTASAAQVRQPIYRDSVGRWRRYEPYLADLRAELGKD